MNHLWDATEGGIIGLSVENNAFTYTYKYSIPLWNLMTTMNI